MEKEILISQKIRKFRINEFIDTDDLIIKESPLTLFINGYQFITLMILKEKLEEMVVGFLVSEGIIEGRNEIKKIEFS